jgi:hypothetical protein
VGFVDYAVHGALERWGRAVAGQAPSGHLICAVRPRAGVWADDNQQMVVIFYQVPTCL